MKTTTATRFMLCLLSLAIAGAVSAQAPATDFPTERTKPATCEDFGWNADMTRDHPRVIDACQEVVQAEGATWARLDARFVKVKGDDTVVFSIRDKRDRLVDEVTMEPAPGQVAYINDRATEFDKLSTTDAINLYVPEGEYGYATQPVPTQRFVRVVPVVAVDPPAAPVVEEQDDEVAIAAPRREVMVADNEPAPAMLPKTAGMLPWALFAGGLLLFAAFSLRLQRKM
jgi:hypothetical protein